MGNSSHKYHHHFGDTASSQHYNSSTFYETPATLQGTGETYSAVAPLLLLLFFIILSAAAILFYFWRKHGYPPMSLMCAHFPEVKIPAVPIVMTNFFERVSSALSPFTLPFARFSNEHSNSNRPQTFVDGGFVSRTRPVAENVDAVWPAKNGLTVPVPVSTPVSGQNNSNPLNISIPALPVVNGFSNQVYDVVDVQVQVQGVCNGHGHGNGLVFDKKPNGNGGTKIQAEACVNCAGRENKENSCEEPVYAAIEVSNDYETLQDLRAFSGQ